jgi:hypothetical protein
MKPEHCSVCNKEISFGEFRYSMNQFKKVLCIHCQKEERFKHMPYRMADLINKYV